MSPDGGGFHGLQHAFVVDPNERESSEACDGQITKVNSSADQALSGKNSTDENEGLQIHVILYAGGIGSISSSMAGL